MKNLNKKGQTKYRINDEQLLKEGWYNCDLEDVFRSLS